MDFETIMQIFKKKKKNFVSRLSGLQEFAPNPGFSRFQTHKKLTNCNDENDYDDLTSSGPL